ncbi:hypothetical protein EJP82_01145 [Paenibacillus anaericanus]|uniref:Uncharacterized protein n=1 Tax=Paenibacillus anaericanus TaxID=170367 RepID=A0A3S1DZH8_9BACL|nr:hypothetical protein [Paenibacillus anaericanus]RUT48577.1 hypothetical protein EJP82_01145 [Paenibacillus anaericanus]
MTIDQYRAFAEEVGGEVGKKIHVIIDELETARGVISGKKLPPLLGNKEVCDKIEVDPKNFHHTRKTKLFPNPDIQVGNRSFWFETTIQNYQDLLDEWRKKKEKN